MKYGIKIILWGAVIFTSVYILRNIIKEINKVRRSEEGKWSDITGGIVGQRHVSVGGNHPRHLVELTTISI